MDEKWADTKDMSKQEMAEEIEKWRTLWSWTCEDVKYLLTRVGRLVRVYTRANKGYLGMLLQPRFILDEMEVGLTEKVYDPNTGNYFWERKIIKIPASGISMMELVDERKVFEELDSTDLQALMVEEESEV